MRRPESKSRIGKSLVTAALGSSLLFGAAVPAHSSTPASDQCAYPQTVKHIIDCACIVAATTVDAVLPGWTHWDCDSNPPI